MSDQPVNASLSEQPVGDACPACRHVAYLIVADGHQAFCGNDDCRVLMWDPMLPLSAQTTDTNLIDMTMFDEVVDAVHQAEPSTDEAGPGTGTVLEQWVIYTGPLVFEVRKWLISRRGIHPTERVYLRGSLDEARAVVREFFPSGYCMPRQPGDDPTIVEVWT